MSIVVCVKHVPDVTDDRRLDPSDHTVERTAHGGRLSPLDEYAVEAALRLRESLPGDVVALTMGPATAFDALRRALQMGADRAVHVVDDALAGSDAVATSLVLAAAVRRIPDVDLVVTGMTSADAAMSVIPSMLAQRLDLAQLTLASEVRVDGRTVTVRRDGVHETQTLAAELPLVLSVTDQTDEPRYPTFRGIRAATTRPVDTWTLTDLGVDPARVGRVGAATRVVTAAPRPARGPGLVVTDAAQAPTVLAEFLTRHGFA